MACLRTTILALVALLACSTFSVAAFAPSRPFATQRSVLVEPRMAVEKDKAKEGDNLFFAVADDATKQQQSPSQPKGELVKTEFYLEILEAIWSVGSDLAKQAFFFMRRTAANALTASLLPSPSQIPSSFPLPKSQFPHLISLPL